ncbi:MAG: hypothetical protein Q4C91_08635 [Eubacteriales bacterium]|nr:hypothetical protein [Eubacteriales bacterium]
MKTRLNRYKFDKISGKMAQDFGTIHKGEEDFYSMILFPMESNMLKLHRQNEAWNGRRAIEAIHICLLTIDGYLKGEEYDFAPFLSADNKEFVNGLLMSFDPFTNDAIHNTIEDDYHLDSTEDLQRYFQTPVMCLLRIEKSIELWTKEMGANGYFIFLENNIGSMVPQDTKMDYTVEVKEKKGIFSRFFQR